VCVKESTTDDDPDGWEIGTALTRSIDRVDFTVLVRGFRDTQLSFEEVFDLCKHVGMDKIDVAVHAMLAAENTGQGRDDAVEAARCVKVGLGLWFLACMADLILKLFDEGGYQGGFAEKATVLAAVEVFIVNALVDQFAPFDAKEKCIVMTDGGS
jgi:hypothetical protein